MELVVILLALQAFNLRQRPMRANPILPTRLFLHCGRGQWTRPRNLGLNSRPSRRRRAQRWRKLHAGSLVSQEHLDTIMAEERQLVDNVLASSAPRVRPAKGER
jgi:hypothetical protein